MVSNLCSADHLWSMALTDVDVTDLYIHIYTYMYTYIIANLLLHNLLFPFPTLSLGFRIIMDLYSKFMFVRFTIFIDFTQEFSVIKWISNPYKQMNHWMMLIWMIINLFIIHSLFITSIHYMLIIIALRRITKGCPLFIYLIFF